MKSIQAAEVLNRILKNTNNDFNNTVCVSIDGVWGIGKTSFIKNYFSENEDKYELIYTSVFGKTSVRDIEKSILIHSLPGFNKVNKDNGLCC